MAFSASGSGKSRVVLSEINVTPLVDVMLVLLIIFMVTTPMMQQGIDIELPETASSGVPTAEEPFVLVIKKKPQTLCRRPGDSTGRSRHTLESHF